MNTEPDYNAMSDDQRIALINNSELGFMIEEFDNLSEYVLKAVITEDYRCLRFYNDGLSDEIQIFAIKVFEKDMDDPNGFEYYPDDIIELYQVFASSSDRVRVELVKRFPDAIRYIKNPAEKVQLAAVKADPEAITYIKNPTKKVEVMARLHA